MIQIQEKKSRIGSQVRRKEASPRKCSAPRFFCRWGLHLVTHSFGRAFLGRRSILNHRRYIIV
ncbi:hypothetical protein Hanom_Chr02g00113961 [Helianthus anomalus]